MSFQGDTPLPAWFMYLQCAPAVRIWSGVGPFRLPADSTDTIGGIYEGCGLLVALTELKIPINGHFAQHELTIAAATAKMLALVNADRASLRYATVSIGVMELGPDYQPTGPVNWLWDAICDGPRTVRRGQSANAVRTIGITCAAGETQRKRASMQRWTGTDQRLRSADDAFCDRVNLYDAGTTERWPN